MKKLISVASIIVITALYCQAIGAVTKALSHIDSQQTSTASQEQLISDLSTKLFYHTTKSESSVSNYSSLPSKIVKTSFGGLWTTLKKPENLYKSAFTHYATLSTNLLIEHRKTALIFPFHYFW